MSAQIRIEMFEEVPVQVDGEPWLQPAGHVVVLRSALKVYNYHKQLYWLLNHRSRVG